jgi:hypothetical protein
LRPFGRSRAATQLPTKGRARMAMRSASYGIAACPLSAKERLMAAVPL